MIMKNGTTRNCNWCNTEFYTQNAQKLHCSDTCANKSRYSRKREKPNFLKNKAILERKRRAMLPQKTNYCSCCGVEIERKKMYCELCRVDRNKINISKSVRRNTLRKKYGITPEEYEFLLHKQKGVCKGCGNPPNGKRLSVDHDHKTGKVRGLLCNHCNIAIGYVNDSPSILQNLIDYLTKG